MRRQRARERGRGLLAEGARLHIEGGERRQRCEQLAERPVAARSDRLILRDVERAQHSREGAAAAADRGERRAVQPARTQAEDLEAVAQHAGG